MEQLTFSVTLEWDDEAHVWYVSDSNVPGLSGEAPDEAAMDKLLDERIPELLRLNMPELFRREAPRHVPFDLLKRIEWWVSAVGIVFLFVVTLLRVLGLV